MGPSTFFFKVFWTVWVPLTLHMDFRMNLSISAKTIGVLIGMVLNLHIALGSIDILTTLSLNP